ncbi:MAG: hypothetical protein FWG94_09475 [Oscillospiraceae bacterium]|nr:hypothetical protein [Oscillospiraceae bacterium]
MQLTVTINLKGNEYNIQADANLPIQNAAQALDENFNLSLPTLPEFYKSALQHRLVSAYFTFAEAEIENGDILFAVK